MLTTTLIVALFLALIAIILLIALTAINLGLYVSEWVSYYRKPKRLKGGKNA